MKKQCKAIGIALFISAVFVLGCSSGKSDAPIRIGTMPASVGVPVQYAYDNGYFEEAGVEVTIELFQTGAPINEAMASGKLDLAFTGGAGIFPLANDTCVLLSELDTAGGMAIYARKNSEVVGAGQNLPERPSVYGSVETLKGAEILLQLGTAGELNAQKYCDLFGLERNEYELIHMDAGPAYQAILAGEADLIAAFPPYSFQLKNNPDFVEVCNYESVLQYEISDSTVATKKIMKENREAVVKVYEAVWKAVDVMADDAARYDYSMKFFADNGRTYTDEMMNQEMEVRRYRTRELLTADNYYFGQSYVEQEDFYHTQGKILDEQLGNIEKNLDPSVLNEVLGITMKMP